MKYLIILAIWTISSVATAQNEIEWMTENLSVTTFRNGDSIQQITNEQDWEKAGNNKVPAWIYKSVNDSTQVIVYNYYAVIDARGLAPNGWKIPTIKELESFSMEIMGDANCWSKNFGKTFANAGLLVGFWSSTEYDDGFAYYLDYTEWLDDRLKSDWALKGLGFSVRCVR
ncbi:MAG: FISUMP domain-containing protein [Crocinitomicaceae bacterium]